MAQQNLYSAGPTDFTNNLDDLSFHLPCGFGRPESQIQIVERIVIELLKGLRCRFLQSRYGKLAYQSIDQSIVSYQSGRIDGTGDDSRVVIVEQLHQVACTGIKFAHHIGGMHSLRRIL